MALDFNLLTLFPEMFPGCLGQSLSGKALENGQWSYECTNIRDFATDTHKSVDDTPYGGGAGMVMRPDIIEKALLSLEDSRTGKLEDSNSPILKSSNPRNIYLSPRGKPLTQALIKDLATEQEITLLCGRYEGIDQRVLDAHNFEEISIGDYILSGGEPAALILMDACIRLLPGVMGNAETPNEESFSQTTGGLLEYPHYTKPAQWTSANGTTYEVPETLTSGHHQNIKQWRTEQSQILTKHRRPDLLRDNKIKTD